MNKEDEKFWHSLFDDFAIPIVSDWSDLPKHIEKIANDVEYRNECVAWWLRKKVEIKEELLGLSSDTVIVVPVSAIKSHPSHDRWNNSKHTPPVAERKNNSYL